MKLVIVNLVQLSSLCGVWLVLRQLARAGRSPRLLLLVAAVAGLASGKYLFSRSEPWDKFADFRDAYWLAGRWVLRAPAELEPLLKLGADGFVNFPIVAYLFAPLGALPVNVAERVWFGLGLGAVFATFWLLQRLYVLDAFERALLLYLLLSFGPLLYSLREGNTSHLLLPVLLWGFTCLRNGRDRSAGVMLGALAFIKLPMLLLGVYFALRRRWSAFVGYWATFAALAGGSVALFGWRMHVLWYEGCIKPFGLAPVPAFNAQSLASVLSRLELGASHLRDWSPAPLSAAGRTIVASLAVVLVVAPLLAAWRARRAPPSANVLDNELLVVSVLSCLISSLCWSHYYVWLVPAAAFLSSQARTGWARVGLVAGWLLAQPAVFLDGSAPSGLLGVALLLLRSHLLWGALLIYACLVWSLSRFSSRFSSR